MKNSKVPLKIKMLVKEIGPDFKSLEVENLSRIECMASVHWSKKKNLFTLEGRIENNKKIKIIFSSSMERDKIMLRRFVDGSSVEIGLNRKTYTIEYAASSKRESIKILEISGILWSSEKRNRQSVQIGELVDGFKTKIVIS